MTNDERRKMIPADIRSAISTLRMLRHDLPDGAYEDVRDTVAWLTEWIRGECEEPSWDDVRCDIDDVCECYALPSLFAV